MTRVAFVPHLGGKSIRSITRSPATFTCQSSPVSFQSTRRKLLKTLAYTSVFLATNQVTTMSASPNTSEGLKITEVKKGDGPTPNKGQMAKVHYTLTTGGFDGKVVDSSRQRGKPFRFTVGVGQVIKGWDEALMKMNVGQRIQLIVPPELGYGQRGAGSAIPPNTTLYFDVELLGLDK